MTIDEAIRHCEEVAWENDRKAMCVEEAYQTTEQQNCEQCAAEHRQLAEWLRELKKFREVYGVCPSYEMCIPECKEGYNAQIAEYERLLKAAVDGFIFLGAWMDDHEDCVLDCSDCPLHRPGFNCRGWKFTADVEKLIGEIDD